MGSKLKTLVYASEIGDVGGQRKDVRGPRNEGCWEWGVGGGGGANDCAAGRQHLEFDLGDRRRRNAPRWNGEKFFSSLYLRLLCKVMVH